MARRRGRGEGSITQRADGRWHARVDLGWEHGQRRRKHLYGSTRQAVVDKLRKAQNQVEDGTPFPDERQIVERFLQSWLTAKEKQLRPRAYQSYEQVIREHVVPGLGKLPLAKLSPQQVAAWFLRHQKEDGASPRTIRYARAVLRAALNQALRWGLVGRNVATLVEPPRYQPREIKPLSPEQARTLLKAVKDHRLDALVSVGLALGLRIGEALGLQWAHVNLERGTISIVQGLERSGGDANARRTLNAERRKLLKQRKASTNRIERRELAAAVQELRKQLKPVRASLRFTEPKTARSRRTITLPTSIIATLKQHRTRQKKERLHAGGDWKDSGLVFTTTIGTALDARNVHREFKAVLSGAGLPAVRFHDLRHTAATLLLAQGVDPRTIMETLGHSQISLTLNTYSHVVPALQEMAAAKMDAILRDR